MEPKAFGPFLTELRKARDLTQQQLAEQLHVSTAAVSKWERGKCLPDVTKLEALAQALDVSVLELLKCEVQEKELPRQELAEVCTQTASAVKKQTARTLRRIFLPLACLAAVLLTFHYFPIYHIVHVWVQGQYSTSEVSDLAYIGSKEERDCAQFILDQAEAAFSDLTVLTPEEAKEKYGLLGKYCICHEDAVAETHSIKLWSARYDENSNIGHMWVYYSCSATDADGNTVRGSRNITSYWTFMKGKKSGKWIVTHISEGV